MSEPPLPHLIGGDGIFKRQVTILLLLFAMAAIIILLCIGMCIYSFHRNGTMLTLPSLALLAMLMALLPVLYQFGFRKVVTAWRTHEAMRNFHAGGRE